jgi:hypothetical protein
MRLETVANKNIRLVAAVIKRGTHQTIIEIEVQKTENEIRKTGLKN